MTARTTARPRPMPIATPAQISVHCASIAAAAADGRIADALDLLQDAHDAGFASPLLELVDAALMPAPADYIEHTGESAPVPGNVLVAVDLGSQARPLVDVASAIYWGPALCADGAGRVQRWARVAN